MLETLITSKTRIKLMLKFFLNSSSTGYLHGLEGEFGESTNAIRQELNRFEEAGLLMSESHGNRKVFRTNRNHPLFTDIQGLVQKYVGIDEIIEKVISHLGEPQAVYLTGNLANGINSDEIHLLIVADKIDRDYLDHLCTKAQKVVSRTIRISILSADEFRKKHPGISKEKLLQVWKKE